MKKILLSICIAMSSMSAFAIRALTVPTVFTQSDGTKITVYMHGDEDFSWYTDVTGNILLRNGNDFTPYTGSKTEFFANATKVRKASILKREPVQTGTTIFPHTGSPKALVILCNFSDVKFSLPNPKKSFDYYLNGIVDTTYNYTNAEGLNNSSVKSYFEAMSNNTFSPDFDIHGPITLPDSMTYYGKGSNDAHYTQVITDALNIMKDSLNMADYDSNNDGVVDLVYVIYAGYGANTINVSDDCLWPKSFNLSSSFSCNGKAVGRCGISNELNGYPNSYSNEPKYRISGTGLFIHEFSHCLGLPDFYTTTSATTATQKANDQEMEFWSIMDGGCYAPKSSGTEPVAYTAWEREAMGWLTIDKLTTSGLVTMKDIDNGGKAYKITNDNDATGNEYFIIQNIQKTNYNSGAPGHGLLVTHVDYDNSFTLNYNSVNNTLGHPRMTVVAADGKLLNLNNPELDDNPNYNNLYFASMEGDPFPGTSKVTNLTDSSAVAPKVYNGSALAKPIFNISESSDGVISFYFMEKPTTAIESVVKENEDDNKIYNINGQFVGTDMSALPKGLYIINKKKVVIK